MVVGADSLPGRSRQLAQLEFLAESVWNDGVAFYVLEADAGLGKTRLVETALDTMGAKGVRTVRAPAAALSAQPLGRLSFCARNRNVHEGDRELPPPPNRCRRSSATGPSQVVRPVSQPLTTAFPAKPRRSAS